MIEKLADKLSHLTHQQLQLAAGVVLIVGLSTAWLAVKAPLAKLQVAQAEGHTHEQSAGLAAPLTQLRDELKIGIEQLSRERLREKGTDGDQVMVEVLSKLHQISSQSNVSLSRISPGLVRSHMMFDEIPFDVEVSGPYREVMEWLLAVETAVPQLAVNQFEVMRSSASGTVVLRCHLAMYMYTEKTK